MTPSGQMDVVLWMEQGGEGRGDTRNFYPYPLQIDHSITYVRHGRQHSINGINGINGVIITVLYSTVLYRTEYEYGYGLGITNSSRVFTSLLSISISPSPTHPHLEYSTANCTANCTPYGENYSISILAHYSNIEPFLTPATNPFPPPTRSLLAPTSRPYIYLPSK